MVINFECQKCGTLFDCDTGTVTFPEDSDKPDFEKEIICPECGLLSIDEVLLTEIGQSQLTDATLGFDADVIFDFEDDELNGFGYYCKRNDRCQTALGRIGIPDDIGGVIAFLCSEEARWVNGQRLGVSGGIFL
jgi:hypothetical protein